MKNLLYKELKLSVHPFFYVLPLLLGGLMMIPQWIFFLVPLYFCFISAPNLMAMYKTNNDIVFSVLLPVNKPEIVKARVVLFVILEMMHLFWALVFAIINRAIYGIENFAFNLNPAFFGLVLVLFGLVNIVLFPIFFRTGYKYGAAVIAANIVGILFAAAAEGLVIFSHTVHLMLEVRQGPQLITLAAGIVLFLGLTTASYKISARRFETVDV